MACGPVFDVGGVDPQGLADVHRPDLRAEVVLEVEAALTSERSAWRFWLTITNVDRKMASRLTIIVSSPRELVELVGLPRSPMLRGSRRRTRTCEVDELQRASEAGDGIGRPVLGVLQVRSMRFSLFTLDASTGKGCRPRCRLPGR